MKKNVLALSITAALVGLGFAGTGVVAATSSHGPQAVVQGTVIAEVDHTMTNTLFTTNSTEMASGAVQFARTDVNGAPQTLGAETGDVFDFQVFLTPDEVWSVNTPLTSGAAGIRVFKDT